MLKDQLVTLLKTLSYVKQAISIGQCNQSLKLNLSEDFNSKLRALNVVHI